MLHAINWCLSNYFDFVWGMEMLPSTQKKFSFSKAALRRNWFMCEDGERIFFDSDVCQSMCGEFYGSDYYLNIKDL